MGDQNRTIAPPNARRDRPHIPPERIATGEEGLLSWDWVEAQLAQSRYYWICTVRSDGKPYARPVWGVYLNGQLYFDGFFKSGWCRNLGLNPAITVHLESGNDTVIVEGHAEITEGMELAERIADAYATKYAPYAPKPDPGGYVLRPQKVLAWRESDFLNTPTRWVFENN